MKKLISLNAIFTPAVLKLDAETWGRRTGQRRAHRDGYSKMTTPQGVPTLMLIDDEPAGRRLISALAARGGWRTIFAQDAETAIAMLGTQDGMMLDAILFDQWDPGLDLTRFITELRERRPALPLLVTTSDSSADTAIAAMRAGATDYIQKPVAPELLLAALNIAVDSAGAHGELRPLTEKIPASLAFEQMIGSAPQFRGALAIAAKAARARIPVLLEGEQGTGKEVFAHAIHAASPRARASFVVMHCGAVAQNLIGSTLFGHERGAFPGAFDRQTGKLHDADTGTIFIDQIELMPLDVQARLVTFMDRGEVHPIGADRGRSVDIRVIAASDTPLEKHIAQGTFREDLYYKLGAVQITLPPMRERGGDIAALARHLIARIGALSGMRSLGITEEAMQLLLTYPWPGNVRQLQDVLFRAAISCEGDALTPTDFPQISRFLDGAVRSHDRMRQGNADGIGVTLYLPDGNMRPLEEIEADVIRLAIGHYRGRMSEVARRLGIGRSTLYRKLADLGIDTAA